MNEMDIVDGVGADREGRVTAKGKGNEREPDPFESVVFEARMWILIQSFRWRGQPYLEKVFGLRRLAV